MGPTGVGQSRGQPPGRCPSSGAVLDHLVSVLVHRHQHGFGIWTAMLLAQPGFPAGVPERFFLASFGVAAFGLGTPGALFGGVHGDVLCHYRPSGTSRARRSWTSAASDAHERMMSRSSSRPFSRFRAGSDLSHLSRNDMGFTYPPCRGLPGRGWDRWGPRAPSESNDVGHLDGVQAEGPGGQGSMPALLTDGACHRGGVGDDSDGSTALGPGLACRHVVVFDFSRHRLGYRVRPVPTTLRL